jgi:hypothetical protein
MAVSASARLWIVSANNATEPLMITTRHCNAAVMINSTMLILTARMPATLASRASSIESCASWVIGSWQPYEANTITLIMSSPPSEELHAKQPIASGREWTLGRNR